MIAPWKCLSSKLVVSDRWIRLRADRCQRSDGHVIDPYYVQEMPDSVCVFALTPDNNVLLTTEYRHGVSKVLIGLPGGVMDSSDDNPQATAERELLEETGYKGDTSDYLGFTYANSAKQTNKVHHFLVRNALRVTEQSLDNNEEILVSELSVSEVTRPGFLVQNGHIACAFLAQAAFNQNKAPEGSRA